MPRAQRSGWRQLRGAVQLAASGADRIAEHIHGLHQAIAAIPFGGVTRAPIAAPAGAAARAMHDGIAAAVYGTIRGTLKTVFGAGALALRLVDAAGIAPVAPARSRALDDLTSAVNGLVGDFMAAQRNPLAVRLGFYAGGERLVLAREALAAAHPDATDRLAIFVHGLCCNETSWELYADAAAPDTEPYARRLARDLGFTPYFVRYNTGLHISQNGRLLARELARLVAAHPVPVGEIVVIGHSMGGLVSRAACHSAARTGATWGNVVSHVICLGAPHLGAPLERAVHGGAALLGAASLTRPWAAILNARSRGIQDLRHGFTADADWRGRDPQRQYQRHRTAIERLPGARYHFIGSSLGAHEGQWLGRLLGDGLVRLSSSTARELEADTVSLGRIHHIRLLNHPAVYREIRARIGAGAH